MQDDDDFVDDVADEQDDDKADSGDLERFESQLPEDAVYLGLIDASVDNWTSWKVEDHYYILPLSDEGFEWGIIRISWDDNWGRYDWSGDARCRGFDSRDDAAKAMITALFEHWGKDLKDEENEVYADFLDSL